MAVQEFVHGMQELDRALELRKAAGSLRRGVGAVAYGLAAYGSPIGAITGVQQPTPPQPPEEPLGDQFGGYTSIPAGDAGGTL